MMKRHKNVEEVIRFMEKKYKIVVIPEDTQNQIQKEAGLQTDKESVSDGDFMREDPRQKENLYIFINDNVDPEQIGYDGFDIS
jgi:hypothetical protein